MPQKLLMAIIGLIFIIVAFFASYADKHLEWAVAIVVGNLWIIASYFKD